MDTNKHEKKQREYIYPCIEVDNPATWPEEVIKLLENNRDLILQYDHFDSNHKDCDIPYKIQNLCMDKYIAAYHYTKEIEQGYFVKNGLKPLSAEHIDWVLNATCSVFTAEEQEKIRKGFMDRFKHGREGLIYFTMTREDSDTTLMNYTKYFGGECIIMNFDETSDHVIADKLARIGIGVIIKICVPVNAICSTWGRSLLANWAKLQKKDYGTYATEGFIKENIPPHNVVKVIYV